MKKILLLLTFIGINYCFCQNKFLSTIDLTSLNAQDISDDGVVSIIQSNDSNYIAVGYFDFPSYSHMIKVNNKGELIWSKILVDNQFDNSDNEFSSIIKSTDNGFAIAGGIDNKISLTRFNNSENILWSKNYTIGLEGSNASKVLQTNDSGFLIGGQCTNSGGGVGLTAYLVKTDGDGKLQWSRRYFDAEYNLIVDIKKTSADYIFLSDNWNASIGTDSACVVKIDSAGNVIWSTYLIANGASVIPKSVTVASDNGYLIGGQLIIDSLNYTSQGFAAKFDNSGKLLWAKYVRPVTDIQTSFTSAVEANSGDFFDGDIVLGGNMSTPDSSFFYLVRVDKDGNVVWTKTISKGVYDIYHGTYELTKTIDGGYISVGAMALSSGSFISAILKLDDNFNSCRPQSSFGSLIKFGVAGSTAFRSSLYTSNVANNDVRLQTEGVYTNICGVEVFKFLHFDATLTDTIVKLNWQINTMGNIDHFNIQRSTDGQNFVTIGSQSISDVSNDYSYEDKAAISLSKNILYYRIQAVDYNGNITNSDIQDVTFLYTEAFNVFPNPANSFIVISCGSAAANTEITITDMSGKRLYVTSHSFANHEQYKIRIPQFASGVYIINIKTESSSYTYKIVVAR